MLFDQLPVRAARGSTSGFAAICAEMFTNIEAAVSFSSLQHRPVLVQVAAAAPASFSAKNTDWLEVALAFG